MRPSTKEILVSFIFRVIILVKSAACNPTANVLSNIGEKLTDLQSCLLVVNIFSDTNNFFPPPLPKGNDQIAFWEDFLSFLVSINGDSAWIIENENGLKGENFKTVFATDEIKSTTVKRNIAVPPPTVSSMEVLSNFRLLHRGFSKCAVTIFLNYIYAVDVLRKRIFVQQHNPFVTRGTLDLATVLIMSFEPPRLMVHGIQKDLSDSGRVFFLQVFPVSVPRDAGNEEEKGIKLKKALVLGKIEGTVKSSGSKISTEIEFGSAGIVQEYNISEKDFRKIKNPPHPDPVLNTEYTFGTWSGPIYFGFFFICPYCHPVYFLPINHVPLIRKWGKVIPQGGTRPLLNVFDFQNIWDFAVVKLYTNVRLTVSFNADVGDPRVVKFCAGSMKLKQSYGCSMKSRKLATLAGMMNVSFTNAKDDWQRSWGAVIFTQFMFGTPTEFLNQRSLQYGQGYDLIYCDYDIRPERFSFSIWVVPIKITVWISVLISIAATCLILVLHKRISCCPTIPANPCLLMDDVFHIFSILVRQGISSSTTSILSIFPYMFIFLSFSATVLLSEYEFFVTAELVVPVLPEKLENLGDIVNNGFVLHNIIVPEGTTQIRETLEMDFSQWNVSDKLNDSVKEVGHDIEDLFKMFAKSRPKFAMLHRGLPHDGRFLLKIVNEVELKGSYNCFLVTNVADRRLIYDHFLNAIGAKCMKLMDRLREAGFYKIWESWVELAANIWFAGKWRMNNQTGREAKADFISFTNLLSFQIVFGVLLVAAGLIWVVEGILGGNVKIVEYMNSFTFAMDIRTRKLVKIKRQG
ncbi:hypothetical protein Fcan01_28420 [Folsomia candida]|uniref:Uncharacterized protein n=1 Tax=Folsomia candida TaxID=158441 RepID=A0A226CTR7_FOLCA|nr:hypothetical protein Fcan01_28420 [Folsomia candida]